MTDQARADELLEELRVARESDPTRVPALVAQLRALGHQVTPGRREAIRPPDQTR